MSILRRHPESRRGVSACVMHMHAHLPSQNLARQMRRATISSRIDLFRLNSSTSQLIESANSIMDQLNIFLVGHLRGVSEEMFVHKVEETFRSMDTDGTDEISVQYVKCIDASLPLHFCLFPIICNEIRQRVL